jgi:UDP-N-acetylmuramyl pentapeptide phosphotransferase/UDP-N-acetylglucosamine-1-phosphate transferase
VAVIEFYSASQTKANEQLARHLFMIILFISFLASAFVGFLILRFEHLHRHLSADHDLAGVQKFHARIVPRIGGLAVISGILVGLTTRIWVDVGVWKLAMLVLLSALPAFAAGLIEDLTKRVSVPMRLAATFVSAALAGYFLNAWVSNVQIIGLDYLLSIGWISVLFTCFAVAGLSNAFNIIDGYNGLVSGVSVIILLAIGYVGFAVQDFMIMACSFAGIGAVVGFMLWNYPRGLLFLGDGGAYLLGFWIAQLSILLVTRNPQVSKWFPVLVCFYPIFETVFTIYRRIILKKANAGLPDAAHLHQLIYRRLVRWSVGSGRVGDRTWRNSLTSPYLWALCLLAVAPAVIFWQYHWVLKGFVLLFAFSYVWLYRALVKFKAPQFLLMSNQSHE